MTELYTIFELNMKNLTFKKQRYEGDNENVGHSLFSSFRQIFGKTVTLIFQQSIFLKYTY